MKEEIPQGTLRTREIIGESSSGGIHQSAAAVVGRGDTTLAVLGLIFPFPLLIHAYIRF